MAVSESDLNWHAQFMKAAALEDAKRSWMNIGPDAVQEWEVDFRTTLDHFWDDWCKVFTLEGGKGAWKERYAEFRKRWGIHDG